MSRPEHSGPAEYFYNEREAAKYAQSSRMIEIQSVISARAIELLNLPRNRPSLSAYALELNSGQCRLGHTSCTNPRPALNWQKRKKNWMNHPWRDLNPQPPD